MTTPADVTPNSKRTQRMRQLRQIARARLQKRTVTTPILTPPPSANASAPSTAKTTKQLSPSTTPQSTQSCVTPNNHKNPNRTKPSCATHHNLLGKPIPSLWNTQCASLTPDNQHDHEYTSSDYSSADSDYSTMPTVPSFSGHHTPTVVAITGHLQRSLVISIATSIPTDADT